MAVGTRRLTGGTLPSHLAPNRISPLISSTFRGRAAKYLIFVIHLGLNVNLICVNLLSPLFSANHRVLPAFNVPFPALVSSLLLSPDFSMPWPFGRRPSQLLAPLLSLCVFMGF